MNKESALKIAIISGLIVAAIAIFVFTPLSEKIFKKDSSVKIIEEKDKSTIHWKDEQSLINDGKNHDGGVQETISNKVGDNSPVESEDFSSYINKYISKLNDKTNIAVTVVDGNGNISSSISSSIANIYTQKGNNGNTGLLRSSFINQLGFQELFEGNSEIIEKLRLSTYTDYIAIGRIRYSIQKGTLVDRTFVCTASITVSIISANKKSIAKSFAFLENGNGVSEAQALEEATQKIIRKFYNDYSTL
jgi:translation elongation factor EF-Ts